jgi:hypothetical protein
MAYLPGMGVPGKKDKEDMLADTAFMQFMITKGIDPSNFSEEELTAIYTDYEGQRSTLKDQKAYANTMRQADLGQGRQAGNIYRASSPLETLGGLAQRGVGEVMAKGIRGKEDALSNQNQTARQAYARELASAVRGGQPQMGAQPAPAGSPQPLTPEMIEAERRRRMGQFST